ncbi:MAG: FkbM family methyltransferase [Solirubrobacteraceae bacterium]
MSAAPSSRPTVGRIARRLVVRTLSAPLEGGEVELRMRVAMVLASDRVRERVRFALNELLWRRGVRAYTLRGSGRTIVLRHPMSDAWVVHEVLERHAYAPPPEVRAALAGLGRPPRVADLGAHIGTTTLELLDAWPDASIVAVEPNPDNAALLRRMITRNGLGDRVRIEQVAAGTAEGEIEMTGFSILSHVVRDEFETTDLWPWVEKAAGGPPPTHRVRVVDAFDLLRDVDVLKLDIEGAEWAILDDPRMADLPARAIVLEFHWQSAPGPDASVEVVRALSAAGYTVGEPFDEHDGVGMVWAWRPPRD